MGHNHQPTDIISSKLRICPKIPDLLFGIPWNTTHPSTNGRVFRAQTRKYFFHIPLVLLLSKMWSSQLINHNEAATEIHIEPSLINKQHEIPR